MNSTPETTPWQSISEDRVGRFSIFELFRSVRRSPRTELDHEFIRLISPDWVNVIPVTDKGALILVEQFRHGNDQVTLEIPGGAVDAGESPAAAAVRELEEETGYRSSQVELIGVVDPNPAFLSNRCYTYLATQCRSDGTLNPDPSEEIEIVTKRLSEFGSLIAKGAITHSLVIAAHYHLLTGMADGKAWAEPLADWV